MAESQLLKNMGDAITEVLPDLPDELVKLVEETLKTLGATTRDDLKYITENDLLPVLKPIQARRLVASWTQNGKFKRLLLNMIKPIKHDYRSWGGLKVVFLNPNMLSSLLFNHALINLLFRKKFLKNVLGIY